MTNARVPTKTGPDKEGTKMTVAELIEQLQTFDPDSVLLVDGSTTTSLGFEAVDGGLLVGIS